MLGELTTRIHLPIHQSPAAQAAAKCEATLKRVREVKKGFNYEMRMSLKNDSRRFEYAEASACVRASASRTGTPLRVYVCDAD